MVFNSPATKGLAISRNEEKEKKVRWERGKQLQKPVVGGALGAERRTLDQNARSAGTAAIGLRQHQRRTQSQIWQIASLILTP